MQEKSDSKLQVDNDQVRKAVKALKDYGEKKSETSKTLVLSDSDEAIQLQFSYKKVPKLDKKNIKLVLPHPTFCPSTSSVCLFVKDLVQTREYQKTISKYKQIFSSCGIKQEIEFYPLKKLKLECTDFEAKRNLSDSYDVFLADSRIIRLLPALLGKHFISRHRFPMQVRLDSKNLNSEITRALSTSQCVLSGKGSTCQMLVGLTSQSDSELVDNVTACMETLSSHIPGGAVNIRNVVLKTHNSKALPIYLSLGPKEEVKLPKETRKREAVKMEEVTTVLGAKVAVTSKNSVRIKSQASNKKQKTADS